MKKTILILIACVSMGCNEVTFPTTIIDISKREHSCHYNTLCGAAFHDTCGKFNIGDTVYTSTNH